MALDTGATCACGKPISKYQLYCEACAQRQLEHDKRQALLEKRPLYRIRRAVAKLGSSIVGGMLLVAFLSIPVILLLGGVWISRVLLPVVVALGWIGAVLL